MTSTSKKRTKATSEKSRGGARERLAPLHPGDLFREVREGQEPKVSQREAARRLDISVKHMYEVENARQPVSVKLALKLEALTGVSAEMWLTLQQRHDLWHERQATRKGQALIVGEPFKTANVPIPNA